MMRYLGIGVGHLQPADFPSEVDAINPWLEELEIPVPTAEVPPTEVARPPEVSEEQNGEEGSGAINVEDIISGDEDGSGDEGLEDGDGEEECDF